jgi:hypothetical protein
LIAGAMLITGMTVIVVRREWFELELFGILASYANHLYWLPISLYFPHARQDSLYLGHQTG